MAQEALPAKILVPMAGFPGTHAKQFFTYTLEICRLVILRKMKSHIIINK